MTYIAKKFETMAKNKTYFRADLFQDNIISARYALVNRDYYACGGLNGVKNYVTKQINRVSYLKICWNCGTAYESHKYNSFTCSPKCRQSLMYKLNRGIKPPVTMEFHMKAKNVEKLKTLMGYK